MIGMENCSFKASADFPYTLGERIEAEAKDYKATEKRTPLTKCCLLVGKTKVGRSTQPHTGTGNHDPQKRLLCRRRPTLPHPPECSTIGAGGLSFRVRNGTGRDPTANTTDKNQATTHPHHNFGWEVSCQTLNNGREQKPCISHFVC